MVILEGFQRQNLAIASLDKSFSHETGQMVITDCNQPTTTERLCPKCQIRNNSGSFFIPDLHISDNLEHYNFCHPPVVA